MAKDTGNAFDGAFFTSVLNRLYTNIYITDMETDEIVYMNDTMKETFHLEDYEGCVCYRVLQRGMEQRCSFCKKPLLLAGKEVCIWNENSTKTGRVYKNYDSLIKWHGKTYHIQNSADVTEYVELSENARMDELTGMLNRRAGKERLFELMEKARREEKILTVALYDVNELKQVNDNYGHVEGDHLLRYISDITRRCLLQEDIIFRLSGDEFILVFYDELLSNARERLDAVKKQLEEEREHCNIFYEASFSYGLVEIYPSDTYPISDIVAKADEQMYIQKRSYHIKRAKEKLFAHSNAKAEKAPRFEYDREHLYEALSASTDDYAFVGNMKTGVFQYPPAMVEEFGLPGQVVEHAAAFWGKLIHPHDEQGFLESNQEIADGRAEYHNIEYRAKNVKGEWIWLRCRGRMLRDERGFPELFAGFITNLGRRSQIDHTTGISNRFIFEGNMKKHLMDRKAVHDIGVMILDMDAFKNINDLYSRSFGDEVLRVSAQRIQELLPCNASLYRLDGDEFGIIILNETEGEYARIYGSIKNKFHRQQEHGGRKYYCTLSGGYASYPQDGDNYLDLLKCANFSLEYSKMRGKNRLTRFSPDILKQKERRLELAELLRESMERGFAGFSICYQPQVDSITKELYGAEALARWECRKYGKVSPGEFIPLLEQNGLIVQLGGWILYHAARQCEKWCKIKPDFRISVNLSYLQLLEGNIVSEIEQTLKEVHLKPDNLTLELTETYLIQEEAATREILEKLHKTGIRLAMDDFGVGYSSLFSLKSIPVDIVKIDKEFVRGITADLFTATFVRAITELCHDVGKKVCLEGVETEEEYNMVKDIGLELIQGFYFGYPIDAQMFEKKWL